jgi:hypothetical protein
MAHPYHHALSSARALQDENVQTPEHTLSWKDHFALHDWLDSSKFAFADARHRSLFHNPAGVKLSTKIFKELKDAKTIANQHITEDMGQVYEIKKWLPTEYFPKTTLHNQKLTVNGELSLSDLKGSLIFNNPFPKEIQDKISMGIDCLLSPEKTEQMELTSLQRFFFFTSTGPYIVEKVLGPTLTLDANSGRPTGNDKRLATRSVFEFFIQKTWGLIPSHQDIMAQRPIEDWMWKKAKPLSKQL